MKKRIECDIELLKSYFDEKDYFQYDSINVDEKHTSVNFIVIEKTMNMQFSIIFDAYYPLTPPTVKAEKKLPIENQYNDKTMCLNLGIDNWMYKNSVLEIMESFLLCFEVHKNYLVLKESATDSNHNRDYKNIMRTKDSLLIPQSPNFEEYIKGKTKVTLKKTINFNGKNVYFLVDFSDRVEKENYLEIPVSTLKHFNKQTNRMSRTFNNTKILELKLKSNSLKYKEMDYLRILNDNPVLCLWDKEKAKHICINTCRYNAKESVEYNSNKKIGILGLGSVGSVMLESLCELGFKNFVLIDNDYYFQHNAHRHVLPKEFIGEQKVTALNKYIKSIYQDIEIDEFAYNLGEVVHNSHNTNIIDKLTKCDVIIDTTSNDNIVPILSSICEKNNIFILSGAVLGTAEKLLVIKYTPASKVNYLDIVLNIFHDNNISIYLDDRKNDGNYFSDRNTWIANKSDVRFLVDFMVNILIDYLEGFNFNYHDIYIVGLKNTKYFNNGFEVKKFFARSIDTNIENEDEL